MHLIASALITSLLVLGSGSAPSDALPGRALHPDLQAALERVPGGVLVDGTTVVWPEQGMTLEAPVARAVGSCATDAVCAYSETNRGGSKLQWTSCGTHSTAALSKVGSIANARSGTLKARAGTTVRASASSGSSANVPAAYMYDITNVTC